MSGKQVRITEIGQTFQPPTLAQANQPANHSVRRALRNSLLDQEFHQGRGVEKALVKTFGNTFGAESGPFNNHGSQVEASLDGVEGVEDWFLVFLQISVVGQWQPFDQDQKGRQSPRSPVPPGPESIPERPGSSSGA